MKTLYIGKYFSDDPAGRYYTDGDGSGEEFREEVLKPLFDKADQVIINIDQNVEGYGSSFLVEAFAGLIKHGYFTKEEILKKLEVKFNDPDFEFYKKKIYQYLNEASYNSVKYESTKSKAIEENRFKNSIDKSFIDKLI